MAINQIFPNSPLSHAIAAVTHGGVARISANNIVGPALPLTRGVGQGDPASSTKFLLGHKIFSHCLEHALKNDQQLKLFGYPTNQIANSNTSAILERDRIVGVHCYADHSVLTLTITPPHIRPPPKLC